MKIMIFLLPINLMFLNFFFKSYLNLLTQIKYKKNHDLK